MVSRDALAQCLLELFGGNVGRGFAFQLSRRRDSSRRVESLFTTVHTGHTEIEESFAETEHNVGTNISLQ